MLQIQRDYSLDQLNTLHLTSTTKHFFNLTNSNQLPQIIDYAKDNKLPVFILGGGSNIILPELYNGLVIHNQLRGIDVLKTDKDSVLIRAMAGEVWDEFVDYTVEHNYFGLENLSLIPGTVGASPIQNIGAYGVEVKDFIEYVEVYDSKSNQNIQLNNLDCQFKYRDSYLKHNPHLIVIAVVFRLHLTEKLNMSYADIAKQLANYTNPTAKNLRECVIKTRQSKLPDPKEIGNVGSFFHNPILPVSQVRNLQTKYSALPVYPINENQAKVSAGWLIDNLGLKGYRLGNVGVYAKQALVLVNHGSATAHELLDLAKYIQNQVWNNYEIKLNIEPLIV